MTIEELERLYREIQIDPEMERRVISAVRAHDRGTSSRKWVPMLAVAAVIAVLAVVIAIRPGGSGTTPPAQSTPPRPTPSQTTPQIPLAIIPTAREDAIVGAVLRHGQPMAGATVMFQASPNSSVHESG